MSNILIMRGIKKLYNKGQPTEISILKGVNLTVKSGELVAMVAPSGAGKSTLLHIAGLLDMPNSGTIFIDGVDYSKLNERARTWCRRQYVGFIYQYHHLLAEFSALENIILPQLANGQVKSKAIERAKNLLNRVNLSARASHRPAQLSGGEQQRVAFCRAIANRPKLLLADEPTGNLDPMASQAVFTTLVELIEETGLAALIATHNIGLASRMDRKLYLDNGILR